MRFKVLTGFLAIFALGFKSFNGASGEVNNLQPISITEESQKIAYQKLLEMEKGMKESIKKLVDQFLPMLMNSNSSVELSGPCMGSILKMIGAMKKMRQWPFEMLDAIGKPEGGTLSGTPSAFGSYQQCIDIVIPSVIKKIKPNVGQYCVVELGLTLPTKPRRLQINSVVFTHINATFESEIMQNLVRNLPVFYVGKYTWGVCLPSTCTMDDLNQVLKPLSKQTGLSAEVRSCEIKEPLKMDSVQIAIASILCLFLVVNILSTIIHEVQLYRNVANQTKPLKGFWITATSYFSIRQNFLKMMKTTEATNRSLDALNGIKFVTMTWVVFYHSYFYNEPRLLRQLRFAKDHVKDIFFQVLLNATLSVSTFFFLTAVLLAYNVVRHRNAGKPMNPFILHFHRCIKFLPVILLIIGSCVLRPLLGSGPLYKENTSRLADICRENWWQNVLFIQNFFDNKYMCELHTWYMAVDIQCFIFGLLYLFILFKNEATAKLFLVVATVASCAGTAYVIYANNFPPKFIVTFIDEEFHEDHERKTYKSAYQYLSLYSAGLFLGTYLAQTSKMKINKFISIICWLVSFAMGLTIVYSVHPWNSGEPYTMLEAISYASLYRLGWAIAVGWVVLACFSGRGGVINDFLSWPGFQPLVRLSYIVYLVHPQVLQTYNDTQQGLSDATHTAIVYKFLATLVISHIIAVFIRVMYEHPLLKIEDDVFKWLERRQAANEKGRTMSVDLHTGVDLRTTIKDEDVKLNKIIVKGVQFTTEKVIANPICNKDAELGIDEEKEKSLDDSHNVQREYENNESNNNGKNETFKLNCT